jgi:predicted DCC family thiol-disulfide oxidoreductase YuxK
VADRIFYDGDCGLCHWTVAFVAPRDRKQVFRFAPLNGETFRALVPETDRARLPDSIVVLTGDGRTLTRSDGALHILSMIGGVWRGIGRVAGLIPRAARDWIYDRIAARRRRLFAPPRGVCPVLPAELRARFDP